jgi:hypothetical protein
MQNLFKIKNLLAAAFLVETVCVTYALLIPALSPVTSILYFISGLLIAIFILLLPKAKQSFSIKENAHHLSTLSFRIVAVIIMCTEMIHFCKKWIDDAPMNYHDADMLPIMKIMSQRFLSGQFSHVYDIIPEIWNGIHPVYLPAMWMPFSIAVAGNFDLRWITTFCLILVFTIFIFVFHPSHQKKVSPFILLCAFLFFWWISTSEAQGLIPYTEEGLVIFYYVLLTLALLNGNIWFLGISIAFCALSRYALIGWLIPLGLLLLYEKKFSAIGKLLVTGFICFFLLMILPFGWTPFATLLSLPGQYINFASRVWHDSPEFFSSGLGFAKFFGASRIELQHKILLTLSFIVPLVFAGIAVWLRDKKNYQINNISLATLKISLVVFYNFIDVPYLYLFYTSSFVSLLIVGYFISMHTEELAERQ